MDDIFQVLQTKDRLSNGYIHTEEKMYAYETSSLQKMDENFREVAYNALRCQICWEKFQVAIEKLV